MNWRSVVSILAILAGAVGCLIALFQIGRDDSPRLEIAQSEQVVLARSDGVAAVESNFLLRNRGTRALVVHGVSPQSPCCERVLERPDQIPPHSEAVVRVEVDANPFSRADYLFLMRTNDPRNEERILKVSTTPAEEPPFFLSQPSRIQLTPHWKTGPCGEVRFETAEKRGDPKWIESVTCDDASVEVASVGEPKTKRELDKLVLRVYAYTLVLRELPSPGIIESQLVVKTRDSEKLIRLSMDIVPAVKLAPSTLFIMDLSSEHAVDLVARDDSAEVTATVVATPDWLRIAESEKRFNGGQRFFVRVTGERTGDIADGRVTFQMSRPGRGTLELRVCVRPAQKSVE